MAIQTVSQLGILENVLARVISQQPIVNIHFLRTRKNLGFERGVRLLECPPPPFGIEIARVILQ